MSIKTQQNFAIILGDVAEGSRIYMDNGETWTIRNKLRDWIILNQDGDQVGGPFSSAMDVEAYVVNQHDDTIL